MTRAHREYSELQQGYSDVSAVIVAERATKNWQMHVEPRKHKQAGYYMTCSPLSYQQVLIVQGHAQNFGVVVKSCMVYIGEEILIVYLWVVQNSMRQL